MSVNYGCTPCVPIVAVFKIGWDVFVVPALFQSRVAVSSTRTRLKLFTLMFNSIVVPCMVVMCSTPTCFRVRFCDDASSWCSE